MTVSLLPDEFDLRFPSELSNFASSGKMTKVKWKSIAVIAFRYNNPDDAAYAQVQFRSGTIQGRSSLPSHRQPFHPEIPWLRADLQECSDGIDDGGW